MLISVAQRKSNIEFWKLYASDLGNKDGRSRDGVQTLVDEIASAKLEKRLTGFDNYRSIAGIALTCVEAWRVNEWFGKRERVNKTQFRAARDKALKKVTSDFNTYKAELNADKGEKVA